MIIVCKVLVVFVKISKIFRVIKVVKFVVKFVVKVNGVDEVNGVLFGFIF